MSSYLTNGVAALYRNEGGQMAFAVLLTLPVVFSFFALGLDAGVWFFDHRTAQNQADAAALAAAQELPNADTTQATDAANLWLAKNGWDPLKQQSCGAVGLLEYSDLDNDGLVDTVRVCVRRQSPGIFASLSNIPFVYVGAAATARVIQETVLYPLMAMNASDCKSLELDSNAQVTVTNGGGVYVRSDCAVGEQALHLDSNAQLIASSIDVVGGAQQNSNAVWSPVPNVGAELLEDPLASLQPPEVSGGCVPQPQFYNSDATISPGIYCLELWIKSNTTVTLTPGVYILKQGLNLDSNAHVTGSGGINDGVLLYNTCPSYPQPCNGVTPSPIEFDSNSQMTLYGHPGFQDIVIWVDGTAGPESLVEFGSNSVAEGRGIIYAVKSKVQFDSNFSGNWWVVADKIKADSNAVINLDYDSALVVQLRTALVE